MIEVQLASETKKPLPKGWRWVKLGEACKVVGGSTPDTSTSDYWDGEIVWVTPTDLGKLSDMIISATDRRITPAGLQSCGTEMLPIGTVVMSSRAPIGHLAIAEVSLCTNQGCKSFVPGTGVDSVFLYWSLKLAVPAIQSLGSGATFTEVSKSVLQQFAIPLPPLNEQKRIANTLREQMVSVEKARAAAEASLEAVKGLPSAFLRQVFPQPGKILSNGWKCAKLGDVVDVRDGTHDTPAYVDDGIPLISSKNLRPSGLDFDGALLISENDYNQIKKRSGVDKGDILFAMIGTIGNPVIVDVERPFSIKNVALFKFNDSPILNKYLYYLLSSQIILHQLAHDTQGGIQKFVTLSALRNLQIYYPHLFEQQQLVDSLQVKMDAAEKARAAAEDELKTINAIPAVLLRRAFSGEI
jgi:type I restriction enzyme S subunit